MVRRRSEGRRPPSVRAILAAHVHDRRRRAGRPRFPEWGRLLAAVAVA
jgi:hypothetical protein